MQRISSYLCYIISKKEIKPKLKRKGIHRKQSRTGVHDSFSRYVNGNTSRAGTRAQADAEDMVLLTGLFPKALSACFLTEPAMGWALPINY